MADTVPCQLNLTDFGVLREKTTQNLRYFINSFGYSTIIL